MRAVLALLVVWPTLGVSVARAQADYYARLGVTFATKLVTDNIVEDIDTRQSLAPTLAFGAALPISPSYRAGLEVYRSGAERGQHPGYCGRLREKHRGKDERRRRQVYEEVVPLNGGRHKCC